MFLPMANPMTEPAGIKPYVYKVMASPVGKLTLIGNDDGLAAVLWPNDKPGRVRLTAEREEQRHPVLRDAAKQLEEYFAGKRRAFTLKLNMQGTAFQKKVWKALLAIPFGETRSYAEVARAIGSPRAVRAVGAANGRNPVSIIAPCHRVVGSDGKLTGFAGGLAVKARLLNLERPQARRARTK